jgi:protein-L-isoaspartate O-methyltransferase
MNRPAPIRPAPIRPALPDLFARMHQRHDRARRYNLARSARTAITILMLGAGAGYAAAVITTLAADYPAFLATAHDRAKG